MHFLPAQEEGLVYNVPDHSGAAIVDFGMKTHPVPPNFVQSVIFLSREAAFVSSVSKWEKHLRPFLSFVIKSMLTVGEAVGALLDVGDHVGDTDGFMEGTDDLVGIGVEKIDGLDDDLFDCGLEGSCDGCDDTDGTTEIDGEVLEQWSPKWIELS